jgi:hypothetical protein
MRQKDLKYFGDIQSGRMNSDDSPFSITTNEWVNAQNVRTGTTDKGVTGVVESVGGNVEIPKPTELASVVINDQKWSLQNLSVENYRNGDPIQYEPDPTLWAALTTGAWCWYDNDPGTGIKLYNWYAVNDPRGLAPEGYHIPSDSEWTIAMYSRSFIYSSLKGGFRNYYSAFIEIDTGYWWVYSKIDYDDFAPFRYNWQDRSIYKKWLGLSVRCLKDVP